MSDDRLSSIEQGIASIKEKLDVVVRLEERQDATSTRMDRQDGRLDSHSHRIGALEKDAAANGTQTGMVERAMWLAISAVIGVAVYFLRGA